MQRLAAPLRRTLSLGRLLLLGGLLLAGCGGCSDQSLRTVPLVNGSIDAFDDGNRVNVAGNMWQGISEGVGTRVDVQLVPGGYGTSAYYLSVQAERPDNATGAQIVGVRASLTETPPAADPNRTDLTADVGAYDGLAFAIRGTPGTYIVQIGSAMVTDFDHFNTYLPVVEEWVEHKIPFEKFTQEGFGTPVAWTGEFVSHVAVYPNITGQITFGIDNVRFYRD